MLQQGDIATWQADDGQWRLVWMLAQDSHEGHGEIYSLAQFIVLLEENPQQLSEEELASLREVGRLGHFPIAGEQVEAAKLQVVGHMLPDDDDMEGYRVWREAFDQGEAGVFTVPLDAVWDMIMESIARSVDEDEAESGDE